MGFRVWGLGFRARGLGFRVGISALGFHAKFGVQSFGVSGFLLLRVCLDVGYIEFNAKLGPKP